MEKITEENTKTEMLQITISHSEKEKRHSLRSFSFPFRSLARSLVEAVALGAAPVALRRGRLRGGPSARRPRPVRRASHTSSAAPSGGDEDGLLLVVSARAAAAVVEQVVDERAEVLVEHVQRHQHHQVNHHVVPQRGLQHDPLPVSDALMQRARSRGDAGETRGRANEDNNSLGKWMCNTTRVTSAPSALLGAA